MAKLGIELVYSQQGSDFKAGLAYSNPRFFTTPRSDVSKVYLVGNWPKIRAAYEALKVPVEQLDAEAAQAPTQRAAPVNLTPVLPEAERGDVAIPDDWRELSYNRPKPGQTATLRGIAVLLSAEPVINRDVAVKAIEAELERRSAAPVLTRAEINADLEGMGIEPDPTMSDEDALAVRNEARTSRDA